MSLHTNRTWKRLLHFRYIPTFNSHRFEHLVCIWRTNQPNKLIDWRVVSSLMWHHVVLWVKRRFAETYRLHLQGQRINQAIKQHAVSREQGSAYSSTLKMETMWPFETPVNFHQTARYYIPKNRIPCAVMTPKMHYNRPHSPLSTVRPIQTHMNIVHMFPSHFPYLHMSWGLQTKIYIPYLINLTLYSPVVPIHTTCFSILKLCILPTECIYAFRTFSK
jgi:hypothetical protein